MKKILQLLLIIRSRMTIIMIEDESWMKIVTILETFGDCEEDDAYEEWHMKWKH